MRMCGREGFQAEHYVVFPSNIMEQMKISSGDSQLPAVEEHEEIPSPQAEQENKKTGRKEDIIHNASEITLPSASENQFQRKEKVTWTQCLIQVI